MDDYKKLEDIKIKGGLHIKPGLWAWIKAPFIAMYFIIRWGVKDGGARLIDRNQKKLKAAQDKFKKDIGYDRLTEEDK